MISGDRGVGKRTFCRALLERLGTDTYLCPISDPQLSAEDFFGQVLADFSAADEEPLVGAADIHALKRYLAPRRGADARAIVLIDEAQQLSLSVFEQIRQLVDLKTDAGPRLHVLLVSPPDLPERLQHPLLRWVHQRVTCWAVLRPLQRDEVGPYIDWRLRVAVDASLDIPASVLAAPVPFLPPAIAAIADASHGNPRVVNVIADRALELAFARQARTIDRPTAEAAIADAGLAIPSSSRSMRMLAAAVAILMAVVLGSILAWQRGWQRGQPEPLEPIAEPSAPP